MELVHCIYVSAAQRDFAAPELEALLHDARRRNAGLGVTGMLLYSDRSFLQVLEGSAAVVEDLYAKIERDPRHGSIVKVVQEPIAARTFSDWTMGFSAMSRRDLARIAGLNDFFVGGACLHELDAGRAKQLLAAFKDGRWRARLSGRSAAGRS